MQTHNALLLLQSGRVSEVCECACRTLYCRILCRTLCHCCERGDYGECLKRRLVYQCICHHLGWSCSLQEPVPLKVTRWGFLARNEIQINQSRLQWTLSFWFSWWGKVEKNRAPYCLNFKLDQCRVVISFRNWCRGGREIGNGWWGGLQEAVWWHKLRAHRRNWICCVVREILFFCALST